MAAYKEAKIRHTTKDVLLITTSHERIMKMDEGDTLSTCYKRMKDYAYAEVLRKEKGKIYVVVYCCNTDLVCVAGGYRNKTTVWNEVLYGEMNDMYYEEDCWIMYTENIVHVSAYWETRKKMVLSMMETAMSCFGV